MQLTLYMMRADVGLDGTIRDLSRFQPVPVQPVGGAAWQLYVNPGVSRDAPWVEHVRPILTPAGLPVHLRNRLTAAVLLVEAHGRVFALTFGQGFHALNSKLIEPGFGLRVTANSVASNEVVSADMHGYGKAARGRRVVLPAADELYLLGIEPNEEWVRKFSGKTDESFAATAVAADSLKLKIKDFSLLDLPSKLGQIVTRHDSDAYKQRYAFLDNMQQLSKGDPLIDELDDKVRTRVLERDVDLGFAAPDLFEQENVDRYVFQYRRRQESTELLATDDVFAALHTLGNVTDPLTKIHVVALNDSGRIGKRYELRDYLQVEEAGDASTRFVLSAGLWFRVAADWIAEVDSYVRGIEDVTNQLRLPDWDRQRYKTEESGSTAEGSYNIALAKRPGYLLLDKKNVHIGGPNQKIEICDLLTTDRQLICVKRATKSATLSHLFAQASVSASLMPEPKYQQHVIGHLQELEAGACYDGPQGWSFIYSIATDKLGALADTLFFFSKVNLVTHARDIRSRGFRVALAKIVIR